ncbi:TldD/PmbA family protein [Romboutsia sp. 1001216sp1]|uniref:TldD/PmbA family protein n=1 Tax=unclassified Romboutsia TaxID=2626894 RepID=UPI0018AC5FDB|nr:MULTISPECIES: TldD/PmbA family protein [unclassified Romboutsia]MDB8794514.1 TldD/PmbA family protein [Romboutsia sp. 1001216sp1]MDB8797644.1 TldD/PmbA family protein [Romboutsia sp. 1001216sp1]MDB8800374.1 TldD/PmbA family protein [Romboutsia sp. 1001216sp1]
MEFNAFRKMLLKKGLEAGFSECEIYYTQGESLSISVYEGEVEKYNLEKSKGLSFRGLINGKMGYSFTEILDFDALNMLIKNAKESALNVESDDVQFIYKGDKDYSEVKTYSEDLENIDPAKMIDLVLNLEKEAKSYDKVVNINGCKISYSSSSHSIYNTNGLELNNKSNILMAYVVPVVEDNGQKQDGIGYSIVNSIENLNPKEIAKDGINEAISKLNGSSIESKKYKTILYKDAMASLLETFSNTFSADAAQRGLSLLKDKEGEIIGSEVLTIVDNPLLDNGLGSTPFDDEGVATYKKELVSSGRLNTLLHNLKTANKANTKSTGNGFKASFASNVGVECSNLYIEAGEKDLDELMKIVDEGIMITDLAGLHSGANPISGDFSLAAKGFYIKDGAKTHPIEQITVAGNYFELLKDIEVVGSDLKFPMSNVGSPSVIVKELSIAGK